MIGCMAHRPVPFVPRRAAAIGGGPLAGCWLFGKWGRGVLPRGVVCIGVFALQKTGLGACLRARKWPAAAEPRGE